MDPSGESPVTDNRLLIMNTDVCALPSLVSFCFAHPSTFLPLSPWLLAWQLLLSLVQEDSASLPGKQEASMNLRGIDVSLCNRAEKEVIEGVCLSYDMVRHLCLETMKECDVVREKRLKLSD